MVTTFRAHYDGKIIQPDEPVALDAGTALVVTVVCTPAGPSGKGRFAKFANRITRAEAEEMQRGIEEEFEKIRF